MPESGVDQARSGVTDLRSVAEQPAPADWRGFMDRQWARPSGDVAEAFLPPPTGQAPHPYGQAAGLLGESTTESFHRFGDGPLRMRMIGGRLQPSPIDAVSLEPATVARGSMLAVLGAQHDAGLLQATLETL